MADETESDETTEAGEAGEAGEPTEQSAWSCYAQAHHRMIADPATLEVLQGVPVVHPAEEQEDTSQLDADLFQAESEVLGEELPPEEDWGVPARDEAQDCFEAEAVLLAAAAGAEILGVIESGGLEEETAARGESPQASEPTGSELVPLPFADLVSRLSSGDKGAWERLAAWSEAGWDGQSGLDHPC